MKSKKDTIETINYLNRKLKAGLDEKLSAVLKKYSYEEEIKWRYDLPEDIPSRTDFFCVSVFFVKQFNEDDYGFDICFTLSENEPFVLSSYVARGNGIMVSHDIHRSIDEYDGDKQIEKRIDKLIYDYVLLSELLVKEYILDSK